MENITDKRIKAALSLVQEAHRRGKKEGYDTGLFIGFFFGWLISVIIFLAALWL